MSRKWIMYVRYGEQKVIMFLGDRKKKMDYVSMFTHLLNEKIQCPLIVSAGMTSNPVAELMMNGITHLYAFVYSPSPEGDGE